MDQNLVSIYNAANALQAQMLKEQLAERGITAWITNEALQGASGELPLGWTSSPRILVASDDAEKARDVALAFDAQIVERARRPNAAVQPRYDTSTDTLDDPGYLWPRCPDCQQARLAVCPFCQTAGNDFPLAYRGPGDGEGGFATKLMVECPTCDEAFEPRFYKLCEQCGHEFPDGVAVRQPLGTIPDNSLNLQRFWIVVGASLAFCGALGLYFWWVVNS